MNRIYCSIAQRMGPEGGEGIKGRMLAGPGDGDCIVVALTENGETITSHYSSSEWWAKHDIGLTSEWKHDVYRTLYPDCYELIWGLPPSEDDRS